MFCSKVFGKYGRSQQHKETFSAAPKRLLMRQSFRSQPNKFRSVLVAATFGQSHVQSLLPRTRAMTSLDAGDPLSGLFPVACNLSASVVPRLLARSEFWFFFGVHLATWGAYQQGWLAKGNGDVESDSQNLTMMSIVTSFFLTFSTNHALARHEQICMGVKRMFNAVHGFACQSRLFLRDQDRPYDRLACRWMALASMLAVIELQYTEVSKKQWVQLRSMGLAREEDVERLRELNSQQRFITIFRFTRDIVQNGLEASTAQAVVVKHVVDCVLQFKECHQDLQDILQVSIPFRYHHLLTVMVSFNMLFLAYVMALSSSVLAPCVFLLVEITFMGMLEMNQAESQQMQGATASLLLPLISLPLRTAPPVFLMLMLK